MDDPNEHLVDGLDSLPEAALERVAASDELRGALRDATARLVRGRARRRRVAWWSGGLAAAYAAGLATMMVVSDRAEIPPTVIDKPAPQTQPVGDARDEPAREAPSRVTVAMLRDPEQLARLIAEARPDEKPVLFREAGDLYLEGMGDIRRATQCYRRALRDRNSNTKNVTGDETWLYRSLREDLNEEKHHANETT